MRELNILSHLETRQQLAHYFFALPLSLPFPLESDRVMRANPDSRLDTALVLHDGELAAAGRLDHLLLDRVVDFARQLLLLAPLVASAGFRSCGGMVPMEDARARGWDTGLNSPASADARRSCACSSGRCHAFPFASFRPSSSLPRWPWPSVPWYFPEPCLRRVMICVESMNTRKIC